MLATSVSVLEATLAGGCRIGPFSSKNFFGSLAMPRTARQRFRRIRRGLFVGLTWLAAALLLVWLVLGPNRLVFDLLAWVWSASNN